MTGMGGKREGGAPTGDGEREGVAQNVGGEREGAAPAGDGMEFETIEMGQQAGLSPGQLVLRRFLRSKLAMVGLAALALVSLFCFAGPLFNDYFEYQQFFDVMTSYDAEGLSALIAGGYVSASDRVNPIYLKESGIKSAVLKATTEEAMDGVFTVAEAVSGAIPEDADPERRYRLYQVSFTDEVKKSLVRDGLSSDSDIQLFNRMPPSTTHLLGTDKDGNDVFTRLMYGGRISLVIGLVCVLIEIAFGMTLGGVSGYYGGILDGLIMRVVDIFNSIPTFPILLLLNSAMRVLKVNERSKLFYLMLIIGVLSWPSIARLVRGQILSLREQEFMIATQATGLRASRRIFRHLIPNVMPQLIVSATLSIGSVIILESALSFLGLGVAIPYATWGVMVSNVTEQQILINCPYVWVPPGLAILVTVMAINFLGDGLRDAFDPKMKR